MSIYDPVLVGSLPTIHENRRVKFSPQSQRKGFHYRNAPGIFTVPVEYVPTSLKNGMGHKTYSNTAPIPHPNKTAFYKEGAFEGPVAKANRNELRNNARKAKEIRKKGNNPVVWARQLHNELTETNNNNLRERTCWNRVCNAVGRCFCLRGGKTRRTPRKQKHPTRKHKYPKE